MTEDAAPVHSPETRAHLAAAAREGGFVPPVILVNAAIRLRRFFLQAADTTGGLDLSSTSPVLFSDCVGDGTDCCNPVCKPNLQGCCYANNCGLPQTNPVKGKGVYAGMSISCSSVVLVQP